MRRVLAAVSGLSAMIIAGLAFGLPAVAAPVPRADLGVSSGSVGGKIGETVEVRLVIRNNGPDALPPESWLLDLQAPAGTRITGGGSAVAGACEHLSERHVRCRYGFGLKRGDRHELKLGLRIVARPAGCGRATVAYAGDPRPGNNAANIRVTVDGEPGNCQAARTSPSPVVSESATPSATPSTEITEAPPGEPSESVLPAYQSNADESGGLSPASILVVGGGLILMLVGGLLIWRMLRKEPEDDYHDDDAAGPIYG